MGRAKPPKKPAGEKPPTRKERIETAEEFISRYETEKMKRLKFAGEKHVREQTGTTRGTLGAAERLEVDNYVASALASERLLKDLSENVESLAAFPYDIIRTVYAVFKDPHAAEVIKPDKEMLKRHAIFLRIVLRYVADLLPPLAIGAIGLGLTYSAGISPLVMKANSISAERNGKQNNPGGGGEGVRKDDQGKGAPESKQ